MRATRWRATTGEALAQEGPDCGAVRHERGDVNAISLDAGQYAYQLDRVAHEDPAACFDLL
jgi:hypothetical protein